MAQVHQYTTPRKKPFEGQFAHMDFPLYKYQEYPKVIGKDLHGQDIIVESQREELEYIARGEVHHAKTQSDEAEKELAAALVAQATEERRKQDEVIAELRAEIAKLKAPSTTLDDLPSKNISANGGKR